MKKKAVDKPFQEAYRARGFPSLQKIRCCNIIAFLDSTRDINFSMGIRIFFLQLPYAKKPKFCPNMVYVLVSDHIGLKFWLVAYRRFNCSITLFSRGILWNVPLVTCIILVFTWPFCGIPKLLCILWDTIQTPNVFFCQTATLRWNNDFHLSLYSHQYNVNYVTPTARIFRKILLTCEAK